MKKKNLEVENLIGLSLEDTQNLIINYHYQARLLKTPGLTYCCGNTCCPPDTAGAAPPVNSSDSRQGAPHIPLVR